MSPYTQTFLGRIWDYVNVIINIYIDRKFECNKILQYDLICNYIFVKFYTKRVDDQACITYSLNGAGVLPVQLTGLQLVKKFPAFHVTRRFITALTNVRQVSLSWASPIQTIYPHPTSWRSFLLLSIHLRLGLSSGLFPSVFPTKNLYTPSPHP